MSNTGRYVPRGYISTSQAVARLFEERHPKLAASEQARKVEESQLRQRPKLTSEQVDRVHTLETMRVDTIPLWRSAASEIREALAEGDLQAIHQTSNGHQAPIVAARWRANDALAAVLDGRIMIVPDYGMSGTEGQALIKQIDLTVWLSKVAPKPFSKVSISLIVQKQPQQTTRPPVPRSLPASDASTESLPKWLTPMEAVAWIVARHPLIVGFASPRRNSVRSFVIDHVLPTGKRVSGEDELPAGMSLRWLDAFAVIDPDETLPTDRALAELHAALQSGRITAKATWVATGERRDMSADEWRILVLDSPPRDDRVLIPYRGDAISPARSPDTRWKDVLLPWERLLAIWPMATVAQAAQTNEATSAEQPEEAAAGIGSSPNLQTSERHAPPLQVGSERRVQRMDESCTLYHAIALLAYRDDDVASRYGAKPGVRESGRSKRNVDLRLPKNTGLPGTEVFAGITDDKRLQPLVQQWKNADIARWRAAKAQLWNAAQSDAAPALGKDGKIAQEFWLTHDLDSVEAEYLRFRRSDLTRLMAEAQQQVPSAWTQAVQLFQSLSVRGIANPEDQVMQRVCSGELTAWLGNDFDFATTWVPIETRLFVLGMTIHSSGRLTKGNVPVKEYAALQSVKVGPVWFRTEDLRQFGLMLTPEDSWQGEMKRPRHMETSRKKMIARFSEKQRRLGEWISFADIADWCARESGSISPDPLLSAKAYRELGTALAQGEFEIDGRTRVIFLNPSVRWYKMTRERFEACPIDIVSDVRIVDGMTSTYLGSCWIPVDMCRRWFSNRRLPLLPWLIADRTIIRARVLEEADLHLSQPESVATLRSILRMPHQLEKLPVAPAALRDWYIERRDSWPSDRKHPSQDEDLTVARDRFSDRFVSRDAIRTVRADYAPAEWTNKGRRKLARK